MAADIEFDNFEEHKVKTGESIDSLAKQHGITWQQLSQFNWGTSDPKHINECLHDLVGCKHKTKDGNNYIFTGKDDPGVICIPLKSPHYQLQTGRTHRIQVSRPHAKTEIEVETVDDFLQVVGHVTLILKRKEGGPDVEITTDEHGYGKARVLTGHYQVTVKGGGPAYFLTNTNQPANKDPGADIGDFKEAVIDTRQWVEALTQLVVARTATPVQKRERRLLQNVYTRLDPVKRKGRGEETSSEAAIPYTRFDKTVCTDNLALIAGWTGDGNIDIASLVSSVLPDFFEGRDGAPAQRDYYVWIVESFAKTPRISIYSASGRCEDSFPLAHLPHGPVGVYSIYESTEGQIFLDMMTKTYCMPVEGRENDFVPVAELVSAADRQRVIDAVNAHAGKAAISYFLPTAEMLQWIGIHGGSGRLEDYGNQEAVNERVHERNKKVCRCISSLYNAYVQGYVKRVKETRNVKELRKLGPPWAPYMMPPPGNASSQQIAEIYDAYDVDQLKPWKAVSEQLDKLAKFGPRMSEGASFISLSAKYEIGGEEAGKKAKEALKKLGKGGALLDEPLPVSIEVEGSLIFQFTDDEIRTLTGLEEQMVISPEGEVPLKGSKYKLGLEYKRNMKEPEKWEVTLHTGPLELEANKEGKAKIAIQALPEIWAEAQYEPESAAFQGGLKIETGAIVEILEKVPVENKELREFFEKYGKKIVPKEISIHAGVVGAREQTVLALVSNAPGFFNVRDLDELVESKWNELTLDERTHLTNLDWNLCSWDLKSYADAELPKTMEEAWGDFGPEQQVAVIHLGFHDVEEYHKYIEESRTKQTGWKDAVKRLQDVCREGDGEKEEKKEGTEGE